MNQSKIRCEPYKLFITFLKHQICDVLLPVKYVTYTVCHLYCMPMRLYNIETAIETKCIPFNFDNNLTYFDFVCVLVIEFQFLLL